MGIRASLAGSLFALGLFGSHVDAVSAISVGSATDTVLAGQSRSEAGFLASAWEHVRQHACVASRSALRHGDASRESVRAECRQKRGDD